MSEGLRQHGTVLFDLDGTLTDSGRGVMNSVAHALRRLELPPLPDEELRRFVGPLPHEPFTARGIDPLVAVPAYREYFTDTGIYENSVYDGIVQLLDGLRSAGTRLAIATLTAG